MISAFVKIALALAGSMLFSGLETGGYLLNRIRLRSKVRQDNRAARRLHYALHDAHRFVFTVLIANNVANYLISRETTRLYLASGFCDAGSPWNAETVAALTLLLPLFLFGELLPKQLFRRDPDRMMYRFSWPLSLCIWLLSPVTAILAAVFNLLTGGRTRRDEPGGFSLTLQGLREYFAENAHPAALSEHQHGMIDNLASMHRISVRQVMRPAAALPQIPLKSTVRQALERIRSGEDELLAVQGGASRQIVGFVSLFALMDPELQPAAPVQPLVEKPVRIAAGMPLTQAFRVLRRHGGQTAAVVDRSARVIGLLHIRDIARYIVKDT